MSGKKRRPVEEPVVEDEEAFPRGGRDDLTPLEKRQLSQQAEADFKQDQQADPAGKQQKKKRKHSNNQDDAEGAFFSRSAAAGKVQHVEQLKYKSLCVGMRLWGCVLEVSDGGLTVSLPHGLRGSVAPEEASDVLSLLLDPSSKRGALLRAGLPGGTPPSLTQLFSVGQYVRASITALTGGEAAAAGGAQDGMGQNAAAGGGSKPSKSSKRIVLSLRLKQLLGGSSSSSSSAGCLLVGQVVPAVVRSVEDRGYSLTFGIKGVSGFLPAKDYSTYYGTDTPLLPGCLLDVVITKTPAAAAAAADKTPAAAAAAGGVYQVSVAHDAVSGGPLLAWEGLTLGSLLPGALVGCKVRQVCADGLLVSFGGFFHGCIDYFHLDNPIPEQDWQQRYQPGQKLPARILYIQPAAKRIGLSCLPHLINARLPAAVPPMGHIFDSAVVARVDQGLGLLLRLPTEPEPCAGFVHVSNLADGPRLEGGQLAKRFSVGSKVRGRVIGFRLMDALVAMSLKESVLEQQVYSVKDLFPGQLLDVTVLDATPAGLVVQITQNLKALVPKTHMTDAGVLPEGSKLPSKLKAGKTLPARVLSVDPVHKRVQLTLKKGLVGSKLPVLADLRQAVVGMKLHGVVTGVQRFGVFVGFYGGVSGLLPKPHLDLLPGQEPGDLYSVGQLLRVQVASIDLRKGGLVLKPSAKRAAEAEEQQPAAAAADAAEPWGGLSVGAVVAGGGVVQQVLLRTPEQGGGLLELHVTGANGRQVLAHLPASHLSDHPGGVEGLMAVLKPGMTLPGPLLVLQQRRLNPATQGSDRWQGGEQPAKPQEAGVEDHDDAKPQQGGGQGLGRKGGLGREEGVPLLLVSRKACLLAAAGSLPAAVSEVVAGAVLPGYVASVTRDAVFVRFLGRCTGRAGLPALADTFVTDPSRHFAVGQSLYASVVAVDGSSSSSSSGSGRFDLSLKPSVVGSHEGAFLAALMSDLELAYQLEQAAAAGGDGAGAEDESSPVDWSLFPVGGAVGAVLHEMRAYGAVMDLQGHPDLVGLVVPEHGGTTQLQGAGRVEPCVLDVAKVQGLVELSMLPELTHMAAAAAAAQAGSSKKAAKKAAAAEQQQQQFAVGSEVQAMVQFIKEQYVVVSIVQQQQQQQQGEKKGKKQQQQQQQYTHLGLGFLARGDFNSQGLAGREARQWSRGQLVAARVAAAAAPGTGGRLLLELSEPLLHGAKGGPSGKAAAAAAGGGAAPSKPPAAGSLVSATVVAVHDLELELAVGKSGSTAHLHVSELQERLTAPPRANPLGQYKVQQQVTAAWLGHVKGLGHKRGKEPQLSVRPSAVAAAKQQQGSAAAGASQTPPPPKVKINPVLSASVLNPGLRVVGWVCGFTKDALWLSLAPELKGRVHVLESGENPEALAVEFEQRFSIGQALSAVVLGLDPKHHTLDLSLRADRLRRAIADPAAAAAAAEEGGSAAAAAAAAEVPEGGALVPGRVVSVSGSGVVVQLGPKLHGLVALTDIHDGWVPNALAGLKPRVYVRARVLALNPGGPGAKPSPALIDGKQRVLLSLQPSDGGLVAAAAAGAQGEAAAAAAAAAGKKQAAAAAAAGGAFGGPLLQPEQLKVGNKLPGYVRSVSSKGLFVGLDRHHTARIKLSQLSDGYVEDPAAAFPVGTLLEGRLLSVEHTKPPAAAGDAAVAGFSGSGSGAIVLDDDDGLRLELSLRSVDGSGQQRGIGDIKEGELTTGKVRRVERYGVFVELARSRVSGLVHISNVGHQGFVKDLAAHYSPGQVVSVRVLSVDQGSGKVSLSMKPELLVGDEGEEGEEDGEAAGGDGGLGFGGKRKQQGLGAAADIDDEMVDAMEVEDREEDEDEEGSEEEEVAEEEEEEQEGSAGGVGLDDMELSEEEGEEEEGGSDAAEEDEQAELSESDQESDSDDDDEEADGLPHGMPAAAAAAGVGSVAGVWGELQLQDGEPGADTGAAANGAAAAAASGQVLSRGDKKRLKAAHEAELAAAERARRLAAAGGEQQQQQAESVAGYEQALLSDPNSSYLWVKLMAFQLKMGEVGAARRVADRALSSIAMTAERDKFNVWVALMNLENAYGGEAAQEAVMTVFKRAVSYCEPKPLYLALLGILERSGRWELAASVWRTATKKFNTSCKVWLGAFESALQAASREAAGKDGSGSKAAAASGDGAAARQVLERALQSLPKRKHIKALTRAALAEFRLGCAERGRSMLESLLANHPKRTDIWSVYIDQEVKTGDASRTRSLLSRATSLSLPPKKMKLLFRRWLEYEQAHGSPADVAAVKQRAVQYMEEQALQGGGVA